MTEKKINLCKKCAVCTGCERGTAKQENLRAVSTGHRRQPDYPLLLGMPAEALLVAADIGTTTIVMQLRRVTDGEILGTFRSVNPQRKYGMDVLSRIQAATNSEEEEASHGGKKAHSDGEEASPAGAEAHSDREETDLGADIADKRGAAGDMQSMVLETLQQGIRQFTEIAQSRDLQLYGMIIAANTTMVHLLMGYPVDTLGHAPFFSGQLEEIQTEIEKVPTLIMPGFSAFVGADILAGVYGLKMGENSEEKLSLLLDLGTNGEMVLGNQNKMLAAATAAGPAFEGRLDADVWGADAIHFLAMLYEKGLVDETGLLADPYFETGVTVGSTVMTQADIRSLQLAKAAVSAGIKILCEEYGMESPREIDRVYLAGGFGYFLDPKDAVTIGLLPRELEEKCVAVGNAALEGAFCYGRQKLWEKLSVEGGKCGKQQGEESSRESNRESSRAEGQGKLSKAVAEMKAKTQVYNLARAHKFEQYYIEAMNLP